MAEDLIVICGAVHGGFGVSISERVNGSFGPLAVLESGVVFPTDELSLRIEAVISEDGERIDLGVAGSNFSAGLVATYARGPAQWSLTEVLLPPVT